VKVKKKQALTACYAIVKDRGVSKIFRGLKFRGQFRGLEFKGIICKKQYFVIVSFFILIL